MFQGIKRHETSKEMSLKGCESKSTTNTQVLLEGRTTKNKKKV